MKKVIIIARAFPPFLPVGHSIRVVKFIKYLPALNWRPVVLTIDDQNEYQRVRKVGSESLLSEIPSQVEIYRTTAGDISLKYLEKEMEFARRNWLTGLIIRILNAGRRWAIRTFLLPDPFIAWLPFALGGGRKIVKDEGIDVIFATCPPYSSSLVGAFLKLFTGKPFILEFRDDWIDTPWFRSRAVVARMIERRLENFAVKSADRVVLVTEWSRKAFINRYPTQPSDKFVLIPNGCDLAEFTIPNSMNGTSPDSKFTVVHAGSLNDSELWGRSPKSLFKAICDIQRQHPDLAGKFRLVFTGNLPEGHLQAAQEMGISGIIESLNHIKRDDFLRLLKSADLLVAINYDGFASLIPGKIYEYWAVGGPPILLLSCPGAAQSLIDEYDLGFTVDPYDADAIRKVVWNAYRRKETGDPIRLRLDGIEKFDRRKLSEKFAQLLSMVTAERM